jgi:hypothetical protein
VSTQYVPILPTKAGELSALVDLTPEVKAALTPLFVIHPIPFDFETDRPSKTADKHVAGLGKKVATAARGVDRAFLDPIFLSDEPTPNGMEDPAQTVITDAAQEGLALVPVIRPEQCDAHTAVAARTHHDTGVGACVRLSPHHWPTTPGRALALDRVLAAVGVGLSDADLVLDLGVEVHSELALELVGLALQSLPDAHGWRSLTLAGGAFPENLSQIPKNQLTRLPRLEWSLYSQASAEATADGLRIPTFGDYAVAHPDPSTGDIDPRVISISAGLRYTIDGQWLVAKGGLFKGTGGRSLGGAAAIPVAQMIAGAPEFCGPDFSAGDAWIDQTANGGTNGGSPQTWRKAATNHHLTFVTANLANPPALSAGS